MLGAAGVVAIGLGKLANVHAHLSWTGPVFGLAGAVFVTWKGWHYLIAEK